MADSGAKLDRVALTEAPLDDEEVALVTAASEPAVDDDDDDPAEEVDLVLDAGPGGRSEARANGVMVLSLLDKIIGAVDQIQQTQTGLEARQEAMEKSVSSIQGELAKLTKSHSGAASTVNKMLEKVRKVSVNVKTVRSNLERQAGQIKKLESNENELLKRRNFKVLIYQDEVKAPKSSKSKAAETASAGEAVDTLEQIPEEGDQGVPANLNSDDEVEIEEIIEESRAERIKRSSKQRVDNIKKASKEKMEKAKLKTKENMEKTRMKTKENLEKTRQRTRENLERTKHSLEKKMGQLGSRMTPNQERKEKLKASKDMVKKSLTPDHTAHARSKTAVYRVPPFTFHVKKIRDGEAEEVVVVQSVETPDAEGQLEAEQGEDDAALHVEVEEGELVRLDSPEMEALLEVAEESQLVLVETDHLKKARSE